MQTKIKQTGLKARFMLSLVLLMFASVVLSACGATNTVAPAATTAAVATTAASAATTAPVATTAAATKAPVATTAGVATTAASAATTAPVATTAAAAPTTAAAAAIDYKVSGNVTLSGAGATFPDPIYQEWLKLFAVANPNVKVTYNPVGSGNGRASFFKGETDFGGTDAFPSDKELGDYGKKVLAIPTTLGSVVVAYNLPGVKDLKLSADTVGGIYTGKISKWNDAKIAAENAGVTLPDTAITLAVRQDSSGTSDVFSKWLAEVSPDFSALAIAGSQPAWEKGGITVSKAPGNDGVTGLIKQTVGGMGYIESSYATANNIEFALMKNPSGAYIKANVESISAAALGAEIPENLKLKVTQSKDPKAYPISATTWVIIPAEIADKGKAEAIVKFLYWVVTEKQPIDAGVAKGYAPLPSAVVAKVQATLKTVTSGGAPVLK